MNSKELYKQFLFELKKIYSANEAALITDWVFEDMGGIKKIELLNNPSHNFSPPITSKLLTALQKLLQNMPVQYVLGHTTFCNLPFKVNTEVLIPRPETEEMVMAIAEAYKNFDKPLQVLDVGTGSGCIAIALKKKLPFATITAVDISSKAIEIAKGNAVANRAHINFVCTNFLDKKGWKNFGTFDIIISNPPYIPLSEKQGLDKNVVSHEPYQALFVPNNDPLLFYKNIVQFGIHHLNAEGKIYVEVHENFAKETAQFFEKNYKNIIIKKDFFEKERVVMATIDC